jgi:hypothetical protein
LLHVLFVLIQAQNMMDLLREKMKRHRMAMSGGNLSKFDKFDKKAPSAPSGRFDFLNAKKKKTLPKKAPMKNGGGNREEAKHGSATPRTPKTPKSPAAGRGRLGSTVSNNSDGWEDSD